MQGQPPKNRGGLGYRWSAHLAPCGSHAVGHENNARVGTPTPAAQTDARGPPSRGSFPLPEFQKARVPPPDLARQERPASRRNFTSFSGVSLNFDSSSGDSESRNAS